MPIGAGLSAQLGWAAETTPGTQVTVSAFGEFNSESLHLDKNIIQGRGIRAGGLFDRSSRRSYTTRSASGDVDMDFPTNGVQAILKQMFGAVSGTSTLTYTPASLTGQSLTIQKGVPLTSGVVKPFTYPGCKIPSWTIDCAEGGIVGLKFTVDAQDEVTSTGIATASYSSTANVFNFSQGVLQLGGTAVASVKGFSVTGAIPMKGDRYFFGAGGKKAEQIENAYRSVSGSLAAEFVDQATMYDVFKADTSVALIMTFTAANGAVLVITCPAIFFDGETPKVGGPDVVDVASGFTALDNGTNPAISLAYTFV